MLIFSFIFIFFMFRFASDPNSGGADPEVRSEASWAVLNATSCGSDHQVHHTIIHLFVLILGCLRKYVSKKLLAFREKKQIALPPSFWCVYDRGKQNPAGDAFEIEKGNGDVRDYNRRTAAAVVLYDTSTVSYTHLTLPTKA